MIDKIKVILDISKDAQVLLDQQDIDLYQELQKEIPSLQLSTQPDPEGLKGGRDLTTVILATASLVSALSPIIIRILNQITPSNRDETWTIEEVETRQHDGTIIVHRKRIRSLQEQRVSGQEA